MTPYRGDRVVDVEDDTDDAAEGAIIVLAINGQALPGSQALPDGPPVADALVT